MKRTLKLILTFTLICLLVACGTHFTEITSDTSPIISLTDVNGTAVLLASTMLAQTMTAVPTSTAVPSATFSLSLTPNNDVQSFQLHPVVTEKGIGIPLYSSDGKWLFLPTGYGVFVLDSSSYQGTRLLDIFPGSSYDNEALSPDGRTLVLGNKLFSVVDGHELSNPKIPLSIKIGNNGAGGLIRTVGFSPDSSMLVATYYGSQLDIWRMQDGKLLYSLQAETMAFSPNSHLMAVRTDLNEDSRIQLYEAQTGFLLKEWVGNEAEFLTDDLLAVETNGATRVYDLRSGKVPYAFSGRYVSFSPDGNLVALLYLDRVEIRRIVDSKLLYELRGDLKDVAYLDLRFTSDGQTLLGNAYWLFCCGGSDRKLFLWRVSDGSLITETRKFYRYSFSPDNGSLAVSTENGLEIWNVADGSLKVEINEIAIP